MPKTTDDAKQWAAENEKELNEARMSCENKDIQMMNRAAPDLSKALWDSGCWLAQELRSHGATDDEVQEIQFAQGQRAFGSDPWTAAVAFANEFEATGTTQDKPGEELAEQINREIFEGE